MDDVIDDEINDEINDEVDEEENENICKICFDKKINTVILPCAHVVVCLECSQGFTGTTNECPICRSQIDKVIKTYRS